MYKNKLCGGEIKCRNCPDFTGYAGDDCDYVSNKHYNNFIRWVCLFILIFIIFLAISIPRVIKSYIDCKNCENPRVELKYMQGCN